MSGPNKYPALLGERENPTSKATFLFGRVGPKQIGDFALRRHFADPALQLNLLQFLKSGTQPPVNAEGPLVDDAAEWQVVEELCDDFSGQRSAFELLIALDVEAVVLRHFLCFVVAADQVNLAGELDFQQKQQRDNLHTVSSPVDVVACN